MLANMASSLILHKRISTTVAKAKALRIYVEPLLTKSKDDSTHSRRTIFAYLGSKEAVDMLFKDISSKIADRPGGYTRIIKLGDQRHGDAAEMCMMELVDFNDLYKKDDAAKKGKTRRGRKGKKADGSDDAVIEAPAAEAKKEKKPKEKEEKKSPKKKKK
jgi:large subunit ribosomal protein L17